LFKHFIIFNFSEINSEQPVIAIAIVELNLRRRYLIYGGLMKNKPQNISRLERISTAITDWMGSTQSIIIHTFFFIGIFALYFFGFEIDQIMLILTTAVSLEAIYLSLFIQMTVNRNTARLEDVTEDIEEIQEDVGEIGGDMDELHVNVKDIGEDVDAISRDVDEIEEDVDLIHGHVQELGKDVDDILEDTDKLSEEEAHETSVTDTVVTLDTINKQLHVIMHELEELNKKQA
jgi:uncharacterized protein YoxC